MARSTSATRTAPARKRKAPVRPSPRGTAGEKPTFLDEASDLATALILERGYDNTPMSMIANALGLTKAGVYHHFDSKEDLLYAVHRRSLDRRLLPIIVAAEKIREPEERLRTFLPAFAKLMTQDPSARILITEARRLSPERSTEIRGVWKRVYRLLRDAIAALQQTNRCRPEIDASFAAFAALGSCCWILFWFDYTRPGSGDAVAATICDVLLSGVLQPAAETR